MQTYTNKAEFFKTHTPEEIRTLLEQAGFEVGDIKKRHMSLNEWRESTQKVMMSDKLVLLETMYSVMLVALSYRRGTALQPYSYYEVVTTYFVKTYEIKFNEKGELTGLEIVMSDGTVIDKLDYPIYVRPYHGYDDLMICSTHISRCSDLKLLDIVHEHFPPRRYVNEFCSY